MSELARQYYKERADRFGIIAPIQLQGSRINLLHPDAVISLHGSPNATTIATNIYEGTVQAAGKYIWKILQSKFDDEQRARASYATGLHTGSLSSALTSKLVPKKQNLRTGKLSNVCIEAVARSELDTALIEQARKGLKITHEESEDTEVYLVTSAELKSGTRKLAPTIESIHIFYTCLGLGLILPICHNSLLDIIVS